MRLTGREDIGLGIEDTFAIVTDTAFLERQLLRRGIEIVRTDSLAETGPGATWEASAVWNGRTFPISIEVTGWSPPGMALLVGRSGGLSGEISAELTALSRTQTRLRVSLTVRGSSFRDRMLLNSAALAKARLTQKFGTVVTAFARTAEARAAQV